MNEATLEQSAPHPTESKLAVGSLTYTRLGLTMTGFWLLLGGFAWALKGRAGQPIVENLLNQFGASDDYSGALVGAMPSVLALFVFPLLGYLSDRFRSRWGRRIPFLAIGLPFLVIAMGGLAASPWLGVQLHLALGYDPSDRETTVLSCLAAFWTMFSFVEILGNTIFAALINDVIPQAVIGRFFGLYRAMTLLAGIVFNYCLFDQADAYYGQILLGIAAFTVVAVVLLCIYVREGTYPPSPPDPRGWPAITREAKDYIHGCFGTPFYVLLFVVWALCTTAWNPVNYYSSSFSTTYIAPSDYATLLTQTYVVSFILAYPLGVLADRFHPLRVGIVALALYALAMLWAGFFATTADNFKIAFFLHGILSGAYLTASASLLQRLFPRLKFAQFATTAAATVCLWNIIIVPFAGTLLGTRGHDGTSLFLLSSVQAGAGVIFSIILLRWFKARGGDPSNAQGITFGR